jgi:hypothetical protein
MKRSFTVTFQKLVRPLPRAFVCGKKRGIYAKFHINVRHTLENLSISIQSIHLEARPSLDED